MDTQRLLAVSLLGNRQCCLPPVPSGIGRYCVSFLCDRPVPMMSSSLTIYTCRISTSLINRRGSNKTGDEEQLLRDQGIWIRMQAPPVGAWPDRDNFPSPPAPACPPLCRRVMMLAPQDVEDEGTRAPARAPHAESWLLELRLFLPSSTKHALHGICCAVVSLLPQMPS